jgi:hypothetical protein
MKLRTFLRRIPQSARSFFGEEGLTLFPFTGPLRRYDRTKLRTDARSGLNVANIAIPSGTARMATFSPARASARSFLRS